MADRYTKGVLTVIAVALVGLFAEQLMTPAHAQIGDGCGSETRPCYIESVGALHVYVVNPSM